MNVTIGDYIRMYRSKRGMTQRQLAEKASYPQPLIAMLETNVRQSVEAGTLERIASVLEMDYEHLCLLQESLEGSIKSEMVERAVRVLNRDL